MNRRFNRAQRNYIIIGLCAILVIMGVGYAAFSSQLKITGTSNIDSTWDVQITDIQSSVVVGTPTNQIEPTHDKLSATFYTKLYKPNDTMKYDITVSNLGSLDAKLDRINVPENESTAISYEVTGIKEGDLLKSNETALLTVIVKYNNVTEQPSQDELNINFNITLEYSQAPNGYVPPVTGPTIGGQEVELVESGDGLYEDSYEAERYIYRGTNPNNYIEFNDELWRIVAKETDGTYKIIRNEVLENRAFDEANHRSTENNTYCKVPRLGCGVYAAVDGTFSSPSGLQSGTVTEDSSIKIYLNEDYYTNNINKTAKEQIIEHSFNIGAVEVLASGDSMEKNIAGEKMYTWTGDVGLINVSDILRASTNPLCTSASGSLLTRQYDACNSNYLLDRASNENLLYWTINAYAEVESNFYNTWLATASSSSAIVAGAGSINSYAPRPVVFLKAETTLSGEGTASNPYTIV